MGGVLYISSVASIPAPQLLLPRPACAPCQMRQRTRHMKSSEPPRNDCCGRRGSRRLPPLFASNITAPQEGERDNNETPPKGPAQGKHQAPGSTKMGHCLVFLLWRMPFESQTECLPGVGIRACAKRTYIGCKKQYKTMKGDGQQTNRKHKTKTKTKTRSSKRIE
jgi:hypothetical protein